MKIIFLEKVSLGDMNCHELIVSSIKKKNLGEILKIRLALLADNDNDESKIRKKI